MYYCFTQFLENSKQSEEVIWMRRVMARTVIATNSFWLCKALREGAAKMSHFKLEKRTFCKMLKFNPLSPLSYVHWKSTKKREIEKQKFKLSVLLQKVSNFGLHTFLIVTKLCPHNNLTGSNLFRCQKIIPLCIL